MAKWHWSWERDLRRPQIAEGVRPYAAFLDDQRAFWEAVGADLASDNEAARRQAFGAFYSAAPVLADVVHERKTHRRIVQGSEEAALGEAVDIVSHLYALLVTDRGFSVQTGRDARPFLRRVIDNWKTDEYRRAQTRASHEVEPRGALSLDLESSSTLSEQLSGSGSSPVENEVLAGLGFAELLSWMTTLGIEEDRQVALIQALYVDDAPYAKIAEDFGFASEQAVRKSFSRTRQRMVLIRDAILGYALVAREFGETASPQEFLVQRGWEERLDRAFSVGSISIADDTVRDFLISKGFDDAFAIKSLTGALHRTAGLVYLVGITPEPHGFFSTIAALGSERGSKFAAYETRHSALLPTGSHLLLPTQQQFSRNSKVILGDEWSVHPWSLNLLDTLRFVRLLHCELLRIPPASPMTVASASYPSGLPVVDREVAALEAKGMKCFFVVRGGTAPQLEAVVLHHTELER